MTLFGAAFIELMRQCAVQPEGIPPSEDELEIRRIFSADELHPFWFQAALKCTNDLAEKLPALPPEERERMRVRIAAVLMAARKGGSEAIH